MGHNLCRYVEAQEVARKARLGIWEYGDVDSDDDEPAPKAPGAWGRRR
jgi:staphylococcal nuclease domain-containing protein 1